MILCGNCSRSALHGQTLVVDDDRSKSGEFPPSDEQPEKFAEYLDLSTIKFIDEEEADEEVTKEMAYVRNGTRFGIVRVSLGNFFSFSVIKNNIHSTTVVSRRIIDFSLV